MAFLKVRNVKGKEDTIINTDLICRIAKSKNGYTVFFSSGNTGAEKDVWAMGVQAGKRRKCPLPLHQMPE